MAVALLLLISAEVAAQAGDAPELISPADWAGLHAAHDEQRRHIRPTADGYEADNPGQRWTTTFDGAGFTTRPEDGGWCWGLQLHAYGHAGEERVLDRSTRMDAAGARLTCSWDDTLDEWFVNDAHGLEHGYTLRGPPSAQSGGGVIVFRLAVRGDLWPEIQSDGRTISFRDAEGRARLSYSGLAAYDADGRALDAHFAADRDGILIAVDAHDAVYPLTIDPLAHQQAYLEPSNPDIADLFGGAVAVSGDTIVVGAAEEDSNATGIDGDQANDGASVAGAAYVFVRNGSTWRQQAYLKASNTAAVDQFGYSVAISGDTIVIGAVGEDSSASTVDGDQQDNSAGGAGAAYVFVRDGTRWSQQAYLKASNAGHQDRFGTSVAVSGDLIVVGADHEDSKATGVNGGQLSNNAQDAGAAYAFVRIGTSWSPAAYLKASNTEAGDLFGCSVAISGHTVVVGALGEDSSATIVGGNQANNTLAFAGAAYVFVLDGSAWTQQAYLKAPSTGEYHNFGSSVALAGDLAVIGAFGAASNRGAAFVFARSGTQWGQEAHLQASNPGALTLFGWSVGVSDERVVVGAYAESSAATGVDGDQFDDSAENAGAAYVFARSASNWIQQAYLKASNTSPSDLFGWSAAMSGATVVVGARDSGSAGAAYVFALDEVWTDLGQGLAGVAGVPRLNGAGTLLPGSPGSVGLVDAAAAAPAIIIVSTASFPTPIVCGMLVPALPGSLVTFHTDVNGQHKISWPSWPSGWSGQSLHLQAVILDPAAACGVSLSNALRADVP